MVEEKVVHYDSVLEGMAHRVIRPFGGLLRCISPNAYALIRWKLGQWWPTNRWLGNPMSQHFLVPLAVRSQDTVLDIGANTGQFTIPLAKLVGPKGAVHSFEPISTTFNELKATIDLAGISGRVKSRQLALGDSAQTVNFTIPKERPTEATAVPHDKEAWADFRTRSDNYFLETCKVVKLDDYIRDEAIGNVAFLKCDVEGGELQVLKGALSLLTRPSPPALMVEIFEGWTKSFGYEPRDLIGFLEKSAGYECYWIGPAGLRRVRCTDPTIPGIFYQWVDFLFVRPATHQKRININRYLSS